MWKQIPNFPDYDINTDGQIRSKKHKKPKVLKPWYNKAGYAMISLRAGGKTHKFYIHRLVWATFNGPIPDGMCVLHGPGNNKSNASLSYLRLGTTSENMMDKVRDGTSNRGERCGAAKLTEVQVKYIRARLKDGVRRSYLARLFEVTTECIRDIHTRRNWSHI